MSIPSIDLLESVHKFPGRYTFKVIGAHRDDLVADVLAAAGAELGPTPHLTHSVRKTPSGGHEAVTLEIEADSAAVVQAIYKRLIDLPGVVAIF
jgi:putative lipoic acid-binding regulatory protein